MSTDTTFFHMNVTRFLKWFINKFETLYQWPFLFYVKNKCPVYVNAGLVNKCFLKYANAIKYVLIIVLQYSERRYQLDSVLDKLKILQFLRLYLDILTSYSKTVGYRRHQSCLNCFS